MLNRLHGHVEREEARWSSYAEDLQQQLDEALDQINVRNLQSSRQKSQNISGGEEDSKDESGVVVATSN